MRLFRKKKKEKEMREAHPFSKRLRFVKEDGKWYIDLPGWTGSKTALMMVDGADDLLDIISNKGDEAILFVSSEGFDGANVIELVKKCWINGADYVCRVYDGVAINHKLWLCNVTKAVLGYFPKRVYFAKLKR